MKKVIIAIILICFSLLGISQTYPTPYQSLGSINIAVRDTGGMFVRQTFVMPVYTDTTAANTMGYPKNYAGSQIFTSGNNKFWIRNFSKTAWINVGSGSGGSATWQDVLTNSPDLTIDNYPNLNYKAFQMSHVGTYSITNSTVSSSHESHIVMDSSDAEISNRDATLHLSDSLATLTSKIQFPHYATSDTDKVVGLDNSGNLVLRTKSSGGGSAWSLLGNSSTTSANFIGTTDTANLVFRVGGTEGFTLGQQSQVNYDSAASSTVYGERSFSLGIQNYAVASAPSYILAMAIGNSCTSIGSSSLAMGSGTISSGAASTAMGESTEASGGYSTAINYGTIASGSISFAAGDFTIASGYSSTSLGEYTTARSFGETSIGLFNEDYTPTSTTAWIGSDRLFQIGNGDGFGDSIAANHNALTILKNGNVGIGTTTPTATLHLINSFRYQDGNEGAGKVLTSDADGNATWQSAGAGTGWGLNGNTGITSANYLGTTDGANLILKSAGNIIDSADGRTIVTTGGNINLISANTITLTSGNNEITLNGVDTSTDATDSILTINTSNIVKKRAYPTMPTNYWNKNADSNIYVIDTLSYVGIGTATPTLTLDVRGAIRAGGVIPTTDSVYPLGISSNRWKELWLNGGDALYLGTVKITDSAFAEGKVLTGSSTGRAVWKTPTATGTVTSIATGLGLSGGTITTSGTLLVDTSSASILSRQRAANTYLLITDTTAFSRKSMPAYSLRVNNTNATANATTDNFRTVGETSLATSDTVTWSGSTAPSGGTSNTYRWTQIGNRVWVDITLSNTSNGSGITGVTVKLPTSLPTPAKPTGQTGASQYLYPVNSTFVSSTNVIISAAARGGIRNNSVNNAFEMVVTNSSIAPSTGLFSFTYTTN